MVHRKEKIDRAVAEIAFYNDCKDYTETVGELLPWTKQGYEARQKAIAEGRVKLHPQAAPADKKDE